MNGYLDNKYLRKLNKKPNVDFELLGKNIGLRIGNLEIKQGDKLTVLNKKDKIVYEGIVKFMLYKDRVDCYGVDDAHVDYWHLGFVLDCTCPNQIHTLMDIFHKARINNWKVIRQTDINTSPIVWHKVW